MARQVQVTSPAELAEIVPYLVGFTPEESLVVLVAREGRVLVSARADLADVTLPGYAEQLLDAMWRRYPDAGGSLIAYTSDREAGWQLIERCVAHRPEAGQLRLVVDGDRWMLPSGESATIDRYGRLAAEATVHGLNRRNSRADLAATFATATPSASLVEVIDATLPRLPAADDVQAAVTRMHELIQANLSDIIGTATAVELAVLTRHPDAHDVAWLSITNATAEQHLRLWRQVANHVPDVLARGPLYLAGLAAWASGDGASANVAIDKALDLAPGGRHSTDRLLNALVNTVTPPAAWAALRADALHDAKPEIQAVLAPPPGWETVTRLDNRRRPEPPAVQHGHGLPI